MKKRLVTTWIASIIILSLVIPVMPTVVMGSIPKPIFHIRDWYDLHAARDSMWGYYLLLNDLDSTVDGYAELAGPTAHGGKGWQPIGGTEWWYDMALYKPFYGILEGDGYEIKDLFIDRPEEFDVGLFGLVDNGGVIRNVGLVNADVTGLQAGGLVGGNVDGTVSNCHFSGTVHGVSRVGGLVGGNVGTVINSYSAGRVSGESYVGGLVGDNLGTVSSSCSAASVIGSDDHIGGLVGRNEGAVINSCSSGTVTGEGSVGGLVGWNSGTVSASYSTGTVAAGGTVGGLVGGNPGTVKNSYSRGSVTGGATVGGLVGWNSGSVSNSYSSGIVSGQVAVGGLVGYNWWGVATVTDSFWDTGTSGLGISAGGTGRTTPEMMSRDTFAGAGWHIGAVDFGMTNLAYTWNIVGGETYPFLSWEQPRGAPIVEYNLAISSTTGGSVTTPGEGAYTYEGGTVVNLAAVAEPGYDFANWTGDVATVSNVNASTTTITMNGNYSIRADFETTTVVKYELVISSTEGGWVSKPGEGTFTHDAGDVVALEATPVRGYRFVVWTGQVGTVSNVNAAVTTITMNGDYTVKANFERVEQDNGCFVATAAYGTDTAEQIDILREFRDTVLLPNSLGAGFVSLYYRVSPGIADSISKYELLRAVVRIGAIDRLVNVLDRTHTWWSTWGSGA